MANDLRFSTRNEWVRFVKEVAKQVKNGGLLERKREALSVYLLGLDNGVAEWPDIDEWLCDLFSRNPREAGAIVSYVKRMAG